MSKLMTKIMKKIPGISKVIYKLDLLQNQCDALKKNIVRLEELSAKLSDKDRGLDYRIDDVYHQIFLSNKEMEQLYGLLLPNEEYKLALCRWYLRETGRTIDLQKDLGFNEKIQKLKLIYGNPQYKNYELVSKLCDKYEVRSWIESHIGEEYLIPLLGKWDSFDEIDFNSLPNQFVLKCNHGSGMNYIVKDKNDIDFSNLRKTFCEWMSINYAFYTGFELQYKNVYPLIIAEKYIEELEGNLFDYKVHCFHGEPQYIQVIGNRDFDKHYGRQLVYDFNWNRQEWSFGDYPKYDNDLDKPCKLLELYEVCKKLCVDFEYVRIDFYIVDEKIIFGEMTFTPGSGIYKYNEDYSEKINYFLGTKINLDEYEKYYL